MVEKSPNAFRTISEVSDALEVPAHVLRFWESKFSQIKPVKRGGGRRYYRPTDLDLIRGIRDLLYTDGLTIKGVQQVLREHGVRHVMELGAVEAGAASKVKEDKLWEEPKGTQLEQPQSQPQEPVSKPDPEKTSGMLFEFAEGTEPAPQKEVVTPVKAKRAPVPAAPECDRGIRSLFDDPAPSMVEAQPLDDAAMIASTTDSGIDKKAEIARVLGKMEQLRDKMKRQ